MAADQDAVAKQLQVSWTFLTMAFIDLIYIVHNREAWGFITWPSVNEATTL